MVIREYDDVKNEYYEVYKCDWTREVVDYDELILYCGQEVALDSLKTFFAEESEKRGCEDYYYDPEMLMFIKEEDLDVYINRFYERAYY